MQKGCGQSYKLYLMKAHSHDVRLTRAGAVDACIAAKRFTENLQQSE